MPAGAARLASHRHEAEIAHRGAVRLGVTIDNADPQALSRRDVGVRQAENAGADNGQIVAAKGLHGRTYPVTDVAVLQQRT